MTTISVVGSTGRVGAALVEHLTARFDVRPVRRTTELSLLALAELATTDAAVVVNAAGVAHVDTADASAVSRLRSGNVDLPIALARAALDARAGLLHISSSKAATPSSSAYAASKAAGEEALEHEFGPKFAAAGLSIVIIRPAALLFPPLDAGKVRRLRFLRHVPTRLVPTIPLPVVAPATFLRIIDDAIDDIVAHRSDPGFSLRASRPVDRGTLRDVASAFRR